MSYIGQNTPAPIMPAHQMPGGPQMPGQSEVGKPNPAGFDTPDFTPDAGQSLPGMPGRETGLGGKQCGPAKDLESLKSLLSSQGVIKPKVELSECGDVDINIFNKMDVIGPEFLQDFHKNIGKAFVGEKLGLQEKALDLIKGVKDSIVTGQKKTLPEIFKAPEKIKPGLSGKNFDWLKTPLVPGGGTKLPPQAEVKIHEFASQSLPQDPMAFVQWVLRESYMENTQSLYDYAEKVRWFNEQKKAVREELESVRNHMAAYPGAEDGDPIAPYTTSEYNLEYTGDMDPNAASDRIKDGQWGVETKLRAEWKPGDVQALGQKGPAGMAGSTEAEMVTITERQAIETGSSTVEYSKGYDGSGSYGEFDSHGDKFVSEVKNDLPTDPAAQEALMEQWQSEGIAVQMNCREKQGWDNQYHQTGNGGMDYFHDGGQWNARKFDKVTDGNSTKMPAYIETWEEAVAWMEQTIEAQITQFKNRVESEEGAIKIHDITFKMDLPNYTVKETQKEVSADSEEAQQYLSTAAGQASAGSTVSTGSPASFTQGDVVDTYGEIETYKTNLEETLNTLGDDAQLANVDLQNWLQKQQQTLQMMSNISKLLHDTAMNTIRKLGG